MQIKPLAKPFDITLDAVASDKSISHRVAIFSFLSGEAWEVRNFLEAQDCLCSLQIARELGADVERLGAGHYRITPPARLREPARVLDCGNSGTAMRIFLGLLAASEGHFVLSGDEYLNARPMRRVAAPLCAVGASIDGRGGGEFAPLCVRGGRLGHFAYDSRVASAQVKTAMILAGLLGSGCEFSEPELSRDHSEKMLAAMGAPIAFEWGEGANYTVQRNEINGENGAGADGEIAGEGAGAGAEISVAASDANSNLGERFDENASENGADFDTAGGRDAWAFAKSSAANSNLNENQGANSNLDENVGTNSNLDENRGANSPANPRKIIVSALNGAKLKGLNLVVPNDPSSCFFFAVAAAITRGARVRIRNVLLNKTRVEAYRVLARMGAEVEFVRGGASFDEVGEIVVRGTGTLRGVRVSERISWLIDEAPALAVAFACADGVSELRGAGELRVKECDRIAVTVAALRAFGVDASELADGFVVRGCGAGNVELDGAAGAENCAGAGGAENCAGAAGAVDFAGADFAGARGANSNLCAEISEKISTAVGADLNLNENCGANQPNSNLCANADKNRAADGDQTRGENDKTRGVAGLKLNPTIDSHGDHRIAMSFAVLATKTGATITKSEFIATSFPNFAEIFAKLYAG